MSERRIGSGRALNITPQLPVREADVAKQRAAVRQSGHSSTDAKGPSRRNDPGAARFATIHELAAKAGTTPQRLDEVAATRLRDLDAISAAAFEQVVGVSHPMPLGPADKGPKTKVAASQIKAIVDAYVQRHGDSSLEQLLASGQIVKVFQTAYRDTFGVEPLATTLPALVNDFTSHLAIYTERPVRLAVASSTRGDSPGVRRFFDELLGGLQQAGLGHETAVLGGFNAAGVSRELYEAADRHAEIRCLGIMPRSGIVDEVARVDAGTIIGVKPGEDAPLYWELSTGSVLICADLDARGRAHLEHHVREGGTAIVLGGFSPGETPPPDSPDILYLPDAASSPAAAATRAIELIVEKTPRRAHAPQSEWLHLPDASHQLIDIESWAIELTTRARMRQLLSFAEDRLPRDGNVRAQLERFGSLVAHHTYGIDPITENALWTRQVKIAFIEAGGELARAATTGLLDVTLGRWFTEVNRSEPPAYFATHTSSLPRTVDALAVGDYTFDVSRYVDFRLGPVTRTILGTPGVEVEVFLGSQEEMGRYYRAQGYGSVHRAPRVHGLEFNILRNTDGKRVVVQGAENGERLAQLGAFLKSYGIPRESVKVLGDLERVRALDRELLQLEIASLDKTIAGVFVPATGATIAALARELGVDESALDVRSHRAGPFAFKSIDVLPAGSDTWQTLLFFEPVLGSSIADVIDVTHSFGARNFAMQGDGHSFDAVDKQGDLHLISGVVKGDVMRRWTTTPNVAVIAPPGAKPHLNQASSTPLEQTDAWIAAATRRGAGNTDQEGSHLFEAVARVAGGSNGLITVQPVLIVHDTPTAGAIEAGKRGQAEYDAEHLAAGHFVTRLGIARVRGRDGELVNPGNPRPGLASKCAPKVDLSTIKVRVADLSTIGDSQTIGSVAAIKGQKPCLLVSADSSTPVGRAELAELLSGLDAHRHWVVLDVLDPHHGELNDVARELGFETVIVGTADDLIERRLQSSPNFFLKQADRDAIATAKAELMRDASADVDANTSRSHTIRVSDELHLYSDDAHTAQSALFAGSRTDGVESIVHTLREESEKAIKRLEAAIGWRRERLGLPTATFYRSNEQLDAFFGARKPHFWWGFSKLSSEDLSHAQRDEAERLVELEALLASPRDTVEVVGITAYGWEKNVQEIKSRPERKFDVLGTITESTNVSALELMKAFDSMPADWQASFLAAKIDDKMRDYLRPLAKPEGVARSEQVALLERTLATEKPKRTSALRRVEAIAVEGLGKVIGEVFAGHTGWEPSDHIAHILPVSVSWTGQGRQALLRLALRYGGSVTNAGGGKILEELIRMQMALGVPTHLWDAMEMSDSAKASGKTSAGASVDMAKLYPAHAFKSVEEYFRRRGLYSRYQELMRHSEALGFDITTLEGVREFSRAQRSKPPKA